MASSSSSSPCLSLLIPPPSLLENWEHDVFPSFHGEDVRKSFLSHVLKEFGRKAINLFIDNEIKRGESIGPELIRAIRGSKIAVVLLSKNYASSSWCLDELVEIMTKKPGQTVIPIFYEVNPTDIEKHTGHFGKVFKRTCNGKDEEKTETWRKALEEVATIAGYHSSVWADEASMIEQIAAHISHLLNHSTPSRDLENFIGLENHMIRINQLLSLDLDEVRMIGIWGPPGIGKSTIARFLFNELSGQFQNSAFMEEIRHSYLFPKFCLDEYNAQVQLQKKMLSEMIDQKDIKISNLGVAKQRLKDRNVLLVLDDVDRRTQVDALAGDVQWFGPGSRIIVTSEDRTLLKAIGIKHIYEVKFPSTEEALQMFCMYVFQTKLPEEGFGFGDDFDELFCEIVFLVGGLPLGLKVMGSHFRGLSKEQWPLEVSKLRTNLNGDIESVLKFSYDALCDEDKELFLHIACFYNGKYMAELEKYLAGRFKNLRQRIYGLKEKALISISIEEDDLDHYYQEEIYKYPPEICKEMLKQHNYDYEGKYLMYGYGVGEECISMHKLLAQLGQDIVHKETVLEPLNHRFLKDYKDACQVLTGSTSTIMTGGEFRVSYDSGQPIFISWEHFPFTCLRSTSDNLEFLVELHLRRSHLKKMWDGTKLLPNLKVLDLSESKKLKELPNLSMVTNLKKLNLEGCSSLVNLPSSIGNAANLQELNLKKCSSLVKLPSSIGDISNLQELNLKGCSSLVKLPSSIGNISNLQELNLKGCSRLVELPRLPKSLSILNAKNCESLENWSFCNPVSQLNFVNCFNLNKEARHLIIQTSTSKKVVLPGREVHACFTYRASGSCLTVKLNQKNLPTSIKFKACILLVNLRNEKAVGTFCNLTCKQINDVTAVFRTDFLDIREEHLYTFDFEIKEVTSTELHFMFELYEYSYYKTGEKIKTWDIKECGILIPGDETLAQQLVHEHVEELVVQSIGGTSEHVEELEVQSIGGMYSVGCLEILQGISHLLRRVFGHPAMEGENMASSLHW